MALRSSPGELVMRKGRLYPAYSLSGSEGEDNSVGPRGGRVGYSQNNHPAGQSQHNHYNTSQHKQRGSSNQQQHQQQHPLYHVTGSGAGLSDTPTSGNASDETLTDCELTHLAREWNGLEGISHSVLGIYDRYIQQATTRLHQLTQSVSRDIHRCDPYEYAHGKTYERLYDFVEYYLTSERSLNENNQCSVINKTYDGVKHNSEVTKYIDGSLLCYGTLYKCERVDLVHIFLYGQDDIYRRYHGFSVVNPNAVDGETVYGVIGDATVSYTKEDLSGIGEHSPKSGELNLTTTELENLKSCPIYGCYCDDYNSPRTVRYFSTKLVTAAVKNNRVITGLRIVVKNGVVSIQIQTGQLIGLGVVDPGSVKWKEVEPVNVIGVDEKSPDAEFVKLDYNTRTLYLDDLTSDTGFYLTGVRFARANGGVRIVAQFVPYENLNLVTNEAPWELERNDANRTELILDNSVIQGPMLNLNTKPISVQNQHYIKFQPSDVQTDAGQTTIPFLDIQPVVTDPPTALGGFGIYLKSQQSAGSFVALKLLSPKY